MHSKGINAVTTHEETQLRHHYQPTLLVTPDSRIPNLAPREIERSNSQTK